jgi:hypothetical protein
MVLYHALPHWKQAMQSGEAKAKRYRERAQQLRDISLDVRGDDDRKTLVEIAKDYDKAAKALEPKLKSTRRA